MPDANKGDLIQIHKIVLEPENRPDNLPPSTAAVPYECWIKGFLMNESANMGDKVKIKTFVGREISGALCEVSPKYDHDFGEAQKEILSVGYEALQQLESKHKANRE
ncbi:MAG: 2-amino-4-ketopentanoate thiolase [Desulfobacteraceae bacterium]|nr:2-amino-4-ketopentanoate thiolase [Desulfobacteraceae bacterium]